MPDFGIYPRIRTTIDSCGFELWIHEYKADGTCSVHHPAKGITITPYEPYEQLDRCKFGPVFMFQRAEELQRLADEISEHDIWPKGVDKRIDEYKLVVEAIKDGHAMHREDLMQLLNKFVEKNVTPVYSLSPGEK